eukprot:1354164-Amorphochlora_amoeboformis.AAC.1
MCKWTNYWRGKGREGDKGRGLGRKRDRRTMRRGRQREKRGRQRERATTREGDNERGRQRERATREGNERGRQRERATARGRRKTGDALPTWQKIHLMASIK